MRKNKSSNLIIAVIAITILLAGLSFSGLLPFMLTLYGNQYWDPDKDVYLYSLKIGEDFDFKMDDIWYAAQPIDCSSLAGAELRLTPEKPAYCKSSWFGTCWEAARWEIDYQGAKGARYAHIDPDLRDEGLPDLILKMEYSGKEALPNGITDYFYTVAAIVDCPPQECGKELYHRYPYGTYIYVAIEGQSKIYDITVFSVGKRAYVETQGAYSAGKYLIWWRADLPAPTERPIDFSDKAMQLYIVRIAVGEPITDATTTFTKTVHLWDTETVTETITTGGTTVTTTRVIYVPRTITITATETVVSGTTKIVFKTITATETMTTERTRVLVKETTVTKTLPGTTVTETRYVTTTVGGGGEECLIYNPLDQTQCLLPECLYRDPSHPDKCLLPAWAAILAAFAVIYVGTIIGLSLAARKDRRR